MGRALYDLAATLAMKGPGPPGLSHGDKPLRRRC